MTQVMETGSNLFHDIGSCGDVTAEKNRHQWYCDDQKKNIVIDNRKQTVKSIHKSTPLSLFDIALRFVADHVSDVASLCGFPEYVGERIFQEAIAMKKFSFTEMGETAVTNILKLFIAAYKEEILHSLNLANSLLVINECLTSLLEVTMYVSELDLRQCSLGDSHELIHHLANMSRLKTLILMDNCLSDEGIRRMTLPFRVMKKGPSSLQELDISYNSKITIKVMPWLSKFPKLKTLNITKTGLVADRQIIESKYGFTYRPVAPPIRSIKTGGWASAVIDDWLSTYSNENKHPKFHQLEHSLPFRRFYKQRKVELHQDMNCTINIEEEPVILMR